MHEISKLYAVAFHFTCIGTSCISGVSAWHYFELIRWLSNKIYRRVVNSTIGVCPNEIYRRIVHSTIEVCPNENIVGLSTVLSECIQMKYIGGLSIVFSESI